MNNSLKIKVKYWFEYLRLAHQSNNSEVAKNLEDKSIYKDWGDYLNTPFDKWWKDHSQLFIKTSQIKRLSTNDMGSDDSFCLQMPFKYAPTTAANIFKEMYEREFEIRRTEKRKLKKVYGGSFELTVDDMKVDRFRYYLHYTKNVYLPLMNSSDKPKTGTFISKAEEVFKSVKKLKKSSEKSTIPFQTSSDVYENLSRYARRYNQYSKMLLLNVSKGVFPGDYEQSKNVDKTSKKTTVYKERKFTKGVPRSKNENYKKRVSGFDMYATRVKK